MILYDLGSITKRKITPEGFLAVDARIARTGIQEYDAYHEIPEGTLPPHIPREIGRIVRLLRPEGEVFSDATMASCRGKSITDGHPNEDVSAENVQKWQVGYSKDTVRRDGDKIAADLVVQAKGTIVKIEKGGVNQISLGYSTDVEWQSGTDKTHGVYDGIQTNIRCNHIAILKSARGGPELRLSDAKHKEEIKSMATRLVDGLTIEVTDQGGQAIDKLMGQLDAVKLENKTVSQNLTDEKSRAEKLSGELDAEKSKALDVKAIDEMVSTRMALVEDAHKLHSGLEATGLSDTEIRKAAIEKASDKFVLDGKSDEYVEAAFDTLVKMHKPVEGLNLGDDLSKLQDGTNLNLEDKARAKMREGRNGGAN